MSRMTVGLIRTINPGVIHPGRRIAAILIGMLLLAPTAAFAAEKTKKGTLSLVLENDLFSNSDRNYTNGVRVSWLSAGDTTPEWVLRLADKFPLFPVGKAVRASYAVGQNMYAPAQRAGLRLFYSSARFRLVSVCRH